MKLFRILIPLASLALLISGACSNDEVTPNPTTTTTPTGTVPGTPGPQVRFQKFGWSVLVPKDAEIIEKGLIQKEADENSGKIEWGDTSKDGLVSLFWIKGQTRQTYDVAVATDSLASSYGSPPVAQVSNFSELSHEIVANFEVDTRSYDFKFFEGNLKGFMIAYQCVNPDSLFFINSIHKETPRKEIEKVLSGFSCK